MHAGLSTKSKTKVFKHLTSVEKTLLVKHTDFQNIPHNAN